MWVQMPGWFSETSGGQWCVFACQNLYWTKKSVLVDNTLTGPNDQDAPGVTDTLTVPVSKHARQNTPWNQPST